MGDYLSILDGLQVRMEGPLNLRFLSQPSVAIFFALKDGIRDARQGRVPYLWAAFSDVGHRRELFLNGWKSIHKVFASALIIDLVFQHIALKDFRLLGALVAGLLLAVVPYLLLRGPVNRLIRRKISM